MQKHDDLTRIKGIGEKRKAWLEEEMNVYWFRDLASLHIDELETRLSETGQPVSRNAVKEWIDQAAILLSQAQNIEGKFVNQFDEKDPHQSSTKSQTWHPVASFVVEYQTRLEEGKARFRTSVHHIEEDHNEMWPMVAEKELCEWMQERSGIQSLNTAVEQQPPITNEITSISETSPMPEKERAEAVEFKQLLVYQPPKASKPVAIVQPGRPFIGNVRADQPCNFTMLFELPEKKEGVKASSELITQLIAGNITTQTFTTIPFKAENARIEDPLYKIESIDTALPTGAYRLKIVARQNLPLSNVSYLELPIMHVF